nr:ribonuclease H-like domain-containing protein [Rhodanobacter sp. C01]
MIDTAFARWQEPVAYDRLLHFDTETTGLAGGTGTRAWMIGAADWLTDGRFRVRQLTTTTMGAETAMLRTFAQWLEPDTVLVSYNGKSYDSPLLKTRYRMARLPDPLSGLGHLDLLHPVRRHWKGVWENCRLATAERELLGVVREDDLPGSEAPAAWLSYLRGGSAVNLRRVLVHNNQDLKSLAGVLLHLARLNYS